LRKFLSPLLRFSDHQITRSPDHPISRFRPSALIRENLRLNWSRLRRAAIITFMTPAPLKPAISFDLLEKIDIRVGTIRSVTDVPDSGKLVQLRVSFGDHERTIVAGMKKERANPQEIEGKQALFVVNLEPRKMRGVVSEGMLFDIGYADGIVPVLAIPEKLVPDGTRAG
jgi:methionine--tRNA ligase beta chain